MGVSLYLSLSMLCGVHFLFLQHYDDELTWECWLAVLLWLKTMRLSAVNCVCCCLPEGLSTSIQSQGLPQGLAVLAVLLADSLAARTSSRFSISRSCCLLVSLSLSLSLALFFSHSLDLSATQQLSRTFHVTFHVSDRGSGRMSPAGRLVPPQITAPQ